MQVQVETQKNGRLNGHRVLQRVPADGSAFVGCLIGGYQSTRENIARAILKDFGIDCRYHFGLEKKTEPKLFIHRGVEIVLVLRDDVLQMMPRIVKACEEAKVEYIEITRKPHTWEPALSTKGFSSPPKWRDTLFNIDKVRPDTGPETRLAYEDPALKARREAQERDAALNPLPAIPLIAPKPAAPTPAPTAPAKPEKILSSTTKTAFAEFGKAVAEAWKRSGLSRIEFAEKIGVSTGSIDNWVHGRGGMPVYLSYASLNAKWPDLFKPLSGLKGESKYAKTMPLVTKPTERVPPPAPYVPPTKEAKAATAKAAPELSLVDARLAADASPPALSLQPAPVYAPPKLSGNVLDDYVAAVQALKAAKAVTAAALSAEAEALARVNTLHQQVIGQ